jgi:hypothetical protein
MMTRRRSFGRCCKPARKTEAQQHRCAEMVTAVAFNHYILPTLAHEHIYLYFVRMNFAAENSPWPRRP